MGALINKNTFEEERLFERGGGALIEFAKSNHYSIGIPSRSRRGGESLVKK